MDATQLTQNQLNSIFNADYYLSLQDDFYIPALDINHVPSKEQDKSDADIGL